MGFESASCKEIKEFCGATWLESFGASLFDAAPGSYIQLVCLNILGVSFGKTVLGLSGHLQPKRLRNFTRDLVLHREEFRDASVILVSPNLLSICGIQQIHMQAQFICALPDSSGQHGPRAQFAADGQRVTLLICRARSSSPGNHMQPRDLRKTMNDAPRNSHSEALRIRID